MKIEVEGHPIKLTVGRGKTHSIRVFEPGTQAPELKKGNEIKCFYINGDETFNSLLNEEFETLDGFLEYVENTLQGWEPKPFERGVEVADGFDEADEYSFTDDGLESRLDACVNTFLDRFEKMPYRHRVEHSIHCDLFTVLEDEFKSNLIQLSNGYSTGLVHKEWPEPKLFGQRTQRGSFDIALLPPTKDTINIERFRNGRIKPVAAFELSLNYGIGHFNKDLATLMNAAIKHSYIIHISHTETGQDEVTRRIEELPNDPGIKIAMVIGDCIVRRV